MHDMQGPRDWMPPPPPSGPRVVQVKRRTPARSSSRALGILSFFLGAAAIVIAIAQPAAFSNYSGYWFSTIGVSAVVFGVVALKRRRRRSLLPVLGIVLGAFGTLAMAFLVIQFYANPASANASPSFAMVPHARSVTPPPAPVASASSPVVDERMQLAQTAGTISFLLKKSYQSSGSYPNALNVTPDGLVMTPLGSVLLPQRARVLYQPAIDGGGYSLTITGSGGAVAEFDTATGVVTMH